MAAEKEVLLRVQGDDNRLHTLWGTLSGRKVMPTAPAVKIF
jgi:hypothetical protein